VTHAGRDGVKQFLLFSSTGVLSPFSPHTPITWLLGFIVKLLEATHGQWIYRNLTIHDQISGLETTKSDEQLQSEIDQQMDLGCNGLDDCDKWMLEVNLKDLENTSGACERYWLIAIKAAKET